MTCWHPIISAEHERSKHIGRDFLLPDLFARTTAEPRDFISSEHRIVQIMSFAFGGAPLVDYNNNATIAHGINQFTMFFFLSFPSRLFYPRSFIHNAITEKRFVPR